MTRRIHRSILFVLLFVLIALGASACARPDAPNALTASFCLDRGATECQAHGGSAGGPTGRNSRLQAVSPPC